MDKWICKTTDNCCVFVCVCRGSYHGGSPQATGLTSNAPYKYPVPSSMGCHNVRLTKLNHPVKSAL